MNIETAAVVTQKASWPAVIVGAAASWLTADLIFAFLGMLIAMAGTGATIYYRRAEHKRAVDRDAIAEQRAKERHLAWLAFLRRQGADSATAIKDAADEARRLGIDTSGEAT